MWLLFFNWFLCDGINKFMYVFILDILCVFTFLYLLDLLDHMARSKTFISLSALVVVGKH